MFVLLILLIVVVFAVVGMVTAPFRYGSRYRHFRGYDPYYNPYRYGCRRHHRLLGGFLPIVALVALDRIFNRRY
jgi:asparagine N-glycosylation enzyme membrane subunit Stt3